MRLVLEEKFNKRVKNEFVYDFDIPERGLYVIEVTGRAKNWFQNTLRLISFFKDDDLAIKIDGREFPKLSGKKGLFDSEAAWNGNKLKDLSQINVFFIHLEQGKHSLRFIADQLPLLETVRIYQVPNEQNVLFKPIKNYQFESGNRRPWSNFILIDLALDSLKIQASADQKHRDDDDLQLKINGERQVNDTPKSHKYWYWCGRVLKGQSRTLDKELNLPTGLHYIELWADNEPVITRAEFTSLKKELVGRVALYRDIVSTSKVAQLRSEADHTKDNIIKALEDGTELVVLEERIEGTRVSGLSNIWHKIKVDDQEGYILSSLVEIAGQEREVIVNKIRRKAIELGTDPDLMIALAGCESRYKPYAVSEDNARGIMQLRDLAVQQVSKSGFSVQDIFDFDQNIEAGIRYFLWIFNSFYKDTTQATEKTIAAYNWKIERVSELFGDGPFNTDQLPEETARHVLCVTENTKKKNWKNIIWPILILTAVIGSLMTIRPSKETEKLFANIVAIPAANSYDDVFPCPRLEAKRESVELIDQDCKITRVLTSNDLRAKEFLDWSSSDRDYFSFALYHDINGTASAQQSREGIIYFLLTTSGFCGSGGCGYVLYAYNTINGRATVVETDIDSVARTLLSPDGKKIAVASAGFHDVCEANSYLRIIDLTSGDRKIINGFEDQELPVTHIRNLRWPSDDELVFSTSHNGDCRPINNPLKREKEFIYDMSRNTIRSRLIREYNSIP